MPRQSGKVKIMMVIAFVIAILFFFIFSRPVLLSFSGPMGGDSEFVIFNPLRNRGSERCAEAFLEQLKGGHCEEEINKRSGVEKTLQSICEKEKKSPLVSWRLGTRRDESATSLLTYWYKCKDRSGEDRLFVWVERQSDSWKVVDYKRSY